MLVPVVRKVFNFQDSVFQFEGKPSLRFIPPLSEAGKRPENTTPNNANCKMSNSMNKDKHLDGFCHEL